MFDYDRVIKILLKKHPYLQDSAYAYKGCMEIFSHHMFIMSKQDFFSYSQILFDTLFDYEINSTQTPVTQISELLLSIYVIYLKNKSNIRVIHKEITLIQYPNVTFDYDFNHIHVCFGVDNNYIMHTAIAIASLLKNSKSQHEITIYIVFSDESISEKTKNKVLSLSKLKQNSSIKFIRYLYTK